MQMLKWTFTRIKKGLYKEYLTKQDNLPVFIGKYLINENLKYNFTKKKSIVNMMNLVKIIV
ncbi:hypothetical protein ACN2C3_03875 [Aliarcobacter butzleri]